jgi:hypothetical protein
MLDSFTLVWTLTVERSGPSGLLLSCGLPLASAFIRTEEKFNKIMGYRDLWALEAILNDAQPAAEKVAA